MKARLLRAFSRVMPGSINLLGMRAALGTPGEVTFTTTGLLGRGYGQKLATTLNQAILRKGTPLLRRGDLPAPMD